MPKFTAGTAQRINQPDFGVGFKSLDMNVPDFRTIARLFDSDIHAA